MPAATKDRLSEAQVPTKNGGTVIHGCGAAKRKENSMNLAPRSAYSLLLAAALAAAGTSAQAVNVHILVQAGQYIAAGKAFDDLNSLEAAVRASSPNRIQLDACGPAATRALKAAAHRFADRPLALRVLDGAAPGCSAAPVAMQAGQRIGTPTGIDDDAVERYWQQLMP
jgi:hypothetical protein